MKRIRLKTLALFACGVMGIHASATASVFVVGSLVRNKNVRPGETFEGLVLLRNTGSEPAEVKVSQTDYTFYADGRSRYGEPGTTPRSNARWISVAPSQLTIPEHETAGVSYRVSVPTQDNLSGTYWSMLMIEPVASPVARAANPDTGVHVQTVVRFGVQIATEVGDGGSGTLQVTNKRLWEDGPKRWFLLDAENAGNRVMIPAIWVELFNKEGISVGKFEGERSRIYPACSVRYHVDVSEVPPGQYTALVILDNGDDHVMGAQYEMAIPR